MALCKLWTAEVVSEAPLLSLAINHSLRMFGHDRLRPVQSEAVQALLQGQDIFVTVPAGCGKSLIYQGGYVDRLQRPRSYPKPVISYTIKELNVLWQTFGGQDFTMYLPPGANKTRTGGSSTGQGQQSPLPKNDQKGKHLGSKLQSWWEKGGVSRDQSTVVELELTKLRVQYEEYPADAAQYSRLALLVQDIEIRDRLSVSAINKLLYQFCSDDMPRQTHANMVMFKAVFMAPERECVSNQEEGRTNQDASHAERVLPDCVGHQKEGVVRLSLLPVRVNLDQDTMFFLQDFFLDISLAPPPSCLQVATGLCHEVPAGKDASETLYIKSFTFSPDVPVRVDYVAKHIDMDKGKVAGVLGGLSHLNCLQISLKSLHTSQGFTTWGELAKFAAHQWQVDITQYQIPRMISSVGPLHYITQFVHGVVDLVWLPWQQYQEDGRMFRGLQRGANSFTSSTGSASLELASRLVAAVEGIVRFASSMTGDELTPARQRPQGMYEGFTTAYGVVSEGVSGTVADVAQVVYTEHQSRGVAAAVGGVVRLVPRMVLRPIIHVSEATRLALTGMRNELVPSARKEDNAKYRPPEKS